MELDFSDQIRGLSFAGDKFADKNRPKLKEKSNAGMGMEKSICKICGTAWGSCSHCMDETNKIMAEDKCPDCGMPMSECKCDSKTKAQHPDVENKKDIESEKGNPNAEKEEEKMSAKQSQESKDIKNIEKKGEMNKAQKVDKEDEESSQHEAGETKEEEDSEDKMDKKMSKASQKIISFLNKKVQKHNENSDRQITLAQLIEVFNRGSKVYENTHRIGVSRNQWAFARVNSFLKMVSNQSVNTAYAKTDSDILTNNFNLENTDFIAFAEIEFQLAKISVLECGLSDTEANELVIFAADSKKKINKTLNKPFRLPSGSKKKFGVYVKNDKGNVVMVKFGDPNMSIKRDDPERRKSYRARHGCDNPGPKWKANYWSCKMWSKTPVSKLTSSENISENYCGCGCGECEEKDIQDLVEIEGAKKGLWDNIREKKKRMGKNYKPAKPGSKDRPDPEAWKKAQAEEYDWDGEEEFSQEEFLLIDPSLASVEEIEE